MIEPLRPAAARLDAWIEREGLRGWDPYDALNSPLLKRLTFGNRRLGQLWVQLLKRSPINLRLALGVPKGYNPKAMGLFLASYWRKYLLTGQEQHLERAQFCACWLEDHASPGYSGLCWGYNFDWPNRGFFAPAGTPTIVNTSFIGLAFLDLVNLGPQSKIQNSKSKMENALAVARNTCDFIMNDLNRIEPTPEEMCFSYTPLDRRYVHNANVLGAQLLAETYARTQERQLAEMALNAARYTARRQEPDGSWKYGEWGRDAWTDNFHTGFVLVALKRVGEALKTDEFEGAVASGYAYWKSHFFRPDGAPRYYHNKVYPIDAHSVAQAVLTFLAFADIDAEGERLAIRTAAWGARHMQDPKGYFHFQINRRYRIKIPYTRWSQAWMQRAFTELQYKNAEAERPSAAAHLEKELIR